MKFSPAGLSLIKAMESCRLGAYQDQAGIWTIGYGHIGAGVTRGLTWTQAQADSQLLADLWVYSGGVASLVRAPSVTDNEFSALTCLAYNIGLHAFAGSSALHLLNIGFPALVPTHIKLWNKIDDGGELIVSKGLVGRRACECALWALPDGSPAPDWNAIRQAAEA